MKRECARFPGSAQYQKKKGGISMGFWFGKFSDNSPWRSTPTKIGKTWYTPSGQQVTSPSRYFSTVQSSGTYWKGNTGWNSKKNVK